MKTVAPALLSAAVAASAHAQSITNIGVLSGDSSSWVGGINANGTVVVGTSSRADGWHTAFRWTRGGGLQGLYGNGIGSTSAVGVSADGGTIVGYIPNRAARWSFSGGVQDLGVLPNLGHNYSYATAVSADGNRVVGMSMDAGNQRATPFLWNAGSGQSTSLYIALNGSSSNETHEVTGMSADGSVYVGYNSTLGVAFRSANGSTNLLTRPNGSPRFGGSFTTTQALGVSSNGSVVVGWSEVLPSSGEAWRWSADSQMVALGHLTGETKSVAHSANWDGSLIVGKSGSRAFVWSQANGMVDLHGYLTGLGVDLTGWNLEIARAISADGTAIAGWGTFNGQATSFVVNGLAIPTPGVCVVLLASGLLNRRRRG